MTFGVVSCGKTVFWPLKLSTVFQRVCLFVSVCDADLPLQVSLTLTSAEYFSCRLSSESSQHLTTLWVCTGHSMYVLARFESFCCLVGSFLNAKGQLQSSVMWDAESNLRKMERLLKRQKIIKKCHFLHQLQLVRNWQLDWSVKHFFLVPI